MPNANTILRLTVLGAGLVSGVAEARDGCAPGTFSTITAPDGQAASFLFDSFSASGRQATRASCVLSVPVVDPKGYSVFAADYRGYAVKGKRQSVSLDAGTDGKTERLFRPKGHIDRDFETRQTIGSTGSSALDLSILLSAGGRIRNGQQPEIYLDSVDVARIGFTTAQSINASLDGLARQRRDWIDLLSATSQQMLGQGQPFDQDSSVSTFGTTDRTGGISARWNASDNLVLLGGLAYANPQSTVSHPDAALLLASAARYALQIDTSWRLYGEVGIWGAPDTGATFVRNSMDMNRLVSVAGHSSGTFLDVHSRLGAVYATDAENEFALSAGLSRGFLSLDGYRESTDNNLFAARIDAQRSVLDSADARVSWTHRIDTTFDYTLSASIGHEFADRNAVSAQIDWAGNASGGWEARNFASVGTRLGWQLGEKWRLDTTIGVFARQDLATAWQWAAEIKKPF